MPELAYCGLNCEECPAYQATVASDTSHQNWLASEYSSPAQLYGPLDMVCFGCHSQRYVSRMCRACEVRRCAMAQVEHTCAECGRFPCQLIERYVPVETDNRNQLEYAHQCHLV